MVQVDLITGFLGSGKTTFMRHYARYMVQQGWNVCILENDFGAVNVDVMLLQDILGDHCDMESISGGCDCDTHQRRMRTKLISLAMQGFDRVIIEPSGIFDVDEFFDILHDEPLDKWYRMGNVIAIVDAKQEQQLSPQSAYLLASETANAGMVVLSRSQLATPAEMDSTVNYLNHALEQNGCARRFGADVLRKNWEDLTPQDLAAVAACGSKQASYEKMHFDQHDVFSSLYFIDRHLPLPRLKEVTGARVAAYDRSVPKLADPKPYSADVRAAFPADSPAVPSGLCSVPADGSIPDGGTLGDLRLIASPGHDDDCVCWYHAPTQTLITGDSVQGNGTPTQGVAFYRNLPDYIRTIRKLQPMAIEHLVCAHDYDGIGSVIHGRDNVRRALADCMAQVERYDAFVRAAGDGADIAETADRMIAAMGCGTPEKRFMAMYTVREHQRGTAASMLRKAVLITGASHGIGAAAAIAFAKSQ